MAGVAGRDARGHGEHQVVLDAFYNILEEFGFELVVAIAQHIKAVPGRKTDVQDSAWICDLLRHGLLKPSFVPSGEQRELRELVRYRRTLIQERTREINRIQKVLEGANIKLASVATNVMSVSGWQILEAMVAGVEDPQTLAAMARGRLKRKQADLEQALVGLVGTHQRFLLQEMLVTMNAAGSWFAARGLRSRKPRRRATCERSRPR